jgi:DNA-binding NarL/FixJ family response regulator
MEPELLLNVARTERHRRKFSSSPTFALLASKGAEMSPEGNASDRLSLFERLTPREKEVLKMLAEGNSAKDVARLLSLSTKTVEVHKFNLMRKLDVHNRAQLVSYAIHTQIIK